MGLCCSRSSTTRVFKISKFSRRTVENESKSLDNIKEIHIKKISQTKPIKKNYFNAIQRNAWTIILDYLIYKELCQAGKVNK